MYLSQQLYNNLQPQYLEIAVIKAGNSLFLKPHIQMPLLESHQLSLLLASAGLEIETSRCKQ